MIDIETRLSNASKNINVTFVDPEVVLAKAKLKKPTRKFDLSKFLSISLKTCFSLALALLVLVPIITIVKDFSGPMSDSKSDPIEPNGGSIQEDESKYIPTESYNDDLIRRRARISDFKYEDTGSNFDSFVDKMNTVPFNLFADVNSYNTAKTNVAYSPVSLYNALSILSRTLEDTDKENVLNYLGVTQEELETYLPDVIKACNKTYLKDEKITGKEILDNSIWLDVNHYYDQFALKDLSEDYYTNSFWGDFASEQSKTNKKMSDYVKDITEGRVEPNFNFAKDSSYVIMSNMFFTDTWGTEESPFEKLGNYEFKQQNGSRKQVSFLGKGHNPGKPIETEKYKSMAIETSSGFKVDFLVPKDGYTVDDLFTTEILNVHKTLEYTLRDENGEYFTDVRFPEFSGAFQGNLLNPILNTIGTKKLSNFGTFATNKETGENDFKISSIYHTTRMSVTYEDEGKSSDENNNFSFDYLNSFNIDRSFIYIIEDPHGVTLFDGITYSI